MLSSTGRDNMGQRDLGSTIPKIVDPAVRIDEASASVTYFGFAEPGTLDADSKWIVKRMTLTGNVTKLEVSGGLPIAVYSWNDRASLSYS